MATIKLSPGNKEAEAAADAAFEEIENKLAHLDGPFYVMDYGKEGAVTLEISSFDGMIRLSFIAVPEVFRGRGLASRTLRFLTSIADKHGVPIGLDVSPQGEGGFTKAQLFKWYGRHGFRRLPYRMQKKLSDAMEREPQKREATIAIRVAAKQGLDVTRIQKFRKDYLMLMKNASRIQDYSMAMAWKGYVSKWTNDFEDYLYKYLIEDLKNLKWRKEITESDWTYWDKRIREQTWDFVMEFRVPISPSDSYYPEESRFAKFQMELPKWKARSDRKARIAWKALEDFAMWYLTRTLKVMQVDVPIPEQMEMEGFSVTVVGADTAKNAAGHIEFFREGLKKYKARASQVYPWLLQHQLPLVLDFKAEFGTGGEYKGRYIWLNGYVDKTSSSESVVHVLAHEMAHHRYYHLGRDAQDFWSRMLSGDLGKVDLREVASKYADSTWIFDNKQMKAEDPMLYQQLMGLKYDRGVSGDLEKVDTIGDIKKYLDGGGDPVVSVRRHPISGYANKNASEAFCEALGYLVAFGPSSLPDVVLDWLRTILPDSRTASRKVVATRPIRIDRGEAVRSVERAMDHIRNHYDLDIKDKLGNRLAFGDRIRARDVDGREFDVEVQYRSKDSSSPEMILGGGSGKNHRTGAPAVVLWLNGFFWPSVFVTTTSGERFLDEAVEVLTHELTHQADKYTRPFDQKKRQTLPTEEELDLKTYYNNPSEVKAYMRSVYEQVLRYMPKLLPHFTINELMKRLPVWSDSWKQVSPHLTEANKRIILKGVYQAIQDYIDEQAMQKAASELERMIGKE